MTKIAASQRQEVVAMCASGKTRAEVGEHYGVSMACIVSILRTLGVTLPRGSRTGRNSSEPTEAQVAMAALYRDGSTLQEIGTKYEISRERVRQILTRRFGITKLHGGGAIRSFKNIDTKIDAAKDRNEKSEARIRKTWGMSLADYAAHVAEYGSSYDKGSPLHKFVQHRKNANYRGISWEFTFAGWWAVWQESGKWNQRGRGKNGYVMARWGDGDAPYSVGTVYICTQPENAKDGYIVSPGAERAAKARITRANNAARSIA